MQEDPVALQAIADLRRLAEAFGERRRQLAAEADLTETQWQVLEEVGGEDFLPSMFARQRAVTAAAVSRTLRQLLERGLVKATIGAADGRQRVYQLTPRGRRALRRVHDARARAVDAVWGAFSRRELEAFSRFAGRLAARMEDYAAARRAAGERSSPAPARQEAD